MARNSDNGAGPLRLLALTAVAAGLTALTAAACVLSYSSIQHLATAAGVSSRLASVYPLISDALLVIAGCSVLALRGAGLPSRVYAWSCLLVLLGGLATGGAVHAAAIRIPGRPASIVAAVVPWALVLIGFGLLLALLRYARIRRSGPVPDQRPAEPWPQAGAEAAAVPEVVAVASTIPIPPRPAEPRPAEPRPAEPKPAARQADLQLRARIPRQSAEQAPASPVTAPHAPLMPPFMPPVALPPAAQEREEETNPRLVSEPPATQGAQAAAGPAADKPVPAADEPGPADPAAASSLNPAPTADDDPGEPPALRRPHSSPIPPED